MEAILLHVTPIYAGLLALLFILLSARVIGRRIGAGVSLGDGGDARLMRRIRVQGNFAEYAPFGVLLLAVAELAGAAPLWLHLCGLLLLAGRIGHAIGLGAEPQIMILRRAGMVATFTALGALGLTCLGLAL